MAADLVTIHHEGAGTPSDDPRGAGGGYTYWIGSTRWERLRSVASSWATLHFNHVSLDICLSGNRMVAVVTDHDIALIHGAFMDAHAHGEIIDVPHVQAHLAHNGEYYYNGSLFSTVCPGSHTMDRWSLVAGACRVPETKPVDWAALAKLVAWQKRVAADPLTVGRDRPLDTAILIELLVHVGMLEKGTHGTAYGELVVLAVAHFKRTRHFSNTNGRIFGGPAAAAILK